MNTVLIAGANRGIGLGLVKAYLEKGDKVIATARKVIEAKELQSLHKQYSDRLCLMMLDMVSEESMSSFEKEIPTITQHVDILINNAGILDDQFSSFSEVTKHQLMKSFEVNSVGPLLFSQKILPLLKKSPNPKIINITSKMGSIADNHGGAYYAYRSSKAALNMITKSMSVDLPKICVACLHPGWVQTDMGGTQAPLSIEESVKGLVTTIGKLKPADTGAFLDYQGERIPW